MQSNLIAKVVYFIVGAGISLSVAAELLGGDPGYDSNAVLLISTKIYLREELLGTPAFEVIPDKKARASVGGIYDISVTAVRSGSELVNISTNLLVDGETANPSLDIKLGEESSIQIGDVKLHLVVRLAKSW